MESQWRILSGLLVFVVASHALADGPSEPGSDGAVDAAAPLDFEIASKDVPKPREIWPIVRQHMVPLEFEVHSDEIVTSDSDPSQRLRKVTAHFWSQELAGKRWGHPCVIFLPEDNSRNLTPERKGKVVIIGSPPYGYYPVHVDKYGEPIAARTGYPTLVLSNPGEYPDGFAIEGDMGVLTRLRKETGKNNYNMNCQLAVVYIQAMNALQQFLGLDSLQAVVGGHSKRGRSATVAAAIDPRVASVIIMGNEGVYATDRVQWHLSFHHAFFQEQVNVPVFYLGATNEDGYKMFNVNLMQQRLKRPMTIEMIPNYCHSNFSEIQYMDFLMWVSHIFDGRPITRIREMSHERQAGRSIFRTKIEGEAKVQIVKAWYVYCDDDAWRDLMWYHLLMNKNGDRYEAVLGGKIPDAFMVEVGDIARGIPGYVSSLPQKLTDVPVVDRHSRGSRPRLWEQQAPTVKLPRIMGEYVTVYRPQGDRFPGPDTRELTAGKWYDHWVPNDHAILKGADNRWHAFGITHPLTSTAAIHEGEFQSFHAMAPKGRLRDTLRDGVWQDQPKVLPPSKRPGEPLPNHAPYIFPNNGAYWMIYGPSPIRLATSKDLMHWRPKGTLFREEHGARDPSVLLWDGTYHLVFCSEDRVSVRTSKDLLDWSPSRTILRMEENIAPESPSLVRFDDTFYLFVCGWNGIWDRKTVQGAYQHQTYVYQSDDPLRFAGKPVTCVQSHAPEVFQGEDGQWYISSVEWPERGVSIAKLVWE